MPSLVSHPDEVKVVSRRFGLGATDIDKYVELDGYKPTDIAAYASQFGLLAPSLQNIFVDGATNTPGANQDEVTLDIELATAIAIRRTRPRRAGPQTERSCSSR